MTDLNYTICQHEFKCQPNLNLVMLKLIKSVQQCLAPDPDPLYNGSLQCLKSYSPVPSICVQITPLYTFILCTVCQNQILLAGDMPILPREVKAIVIFGLAGWVNG